MSADVEEESGLQCFYYHSITGDGDGCSGDNDCGCSGGDCSGADGAKGMNREFVGVLLSNYLTG